MGQCYWDQDSFPFESCCEVDLCAGKSLQSLPFDCSLPVKETKTGYAKSVLRFFDFKNGGR